MAFFRAACRAAAPLGARGNTTSASVAAAAASNSLRPSVTNIPLRSALFVPGTKASKALSKPGGPDSFILDLEDGVAPGMKAAAREAVVAALSSAPPRSQDSRYRILRVNGLDTSEVAGDVKVAAALARGGQLDAVALPKVSSASDLSELRAKLSAEGCPASLSLWAMIETPLGVLRVGEVAAASKEVGCVGLVAGTSDLTKELRALHTPSRQPVLYSLSAIVVAARAFGLRALDGVHLALDDEDGLREVCAQGRELGFDGKTLIHPSQVEEANVAFGPSQQDVETARKIVAAWSAEEASKGASFAGLVVVDGRLVENLHVDEAKATIAMAEMIARRAAAAAAGGAGGGGGGKKT